MNSVIDNNKLKLSGKVVSVPEFQFEIYTESFFSFDLEVPRLSENYDVLKCLVSEKLLSGIEIEKYISLDGQLRTYNQLEGKKRKLLIYAFARDINVISYEEFLGIESPNEIQLTGFICKEPIYRTTPFGREISDILIAVNRAHNKSDYIPCISWGRNAKFCNHIPVGKEVDVIGRLQSRNYVKKDGEIEINKIAYEISISKIDVKKEEQAETITE